MATANWQRPRDAVVVGSAVAGPRWSTSSRQRAECEGVGLRVRPAGAQHLDRVGHHLHAGAGPQPRRAARGEHAVEHDPAGEQLRVEVHLLLADVRIGDAGHRGELGSRQRRRHRDVRHLPRRAGPAVVTPRRIRWSASAPPSPSSSATPLVRSTTELPPRLTRQSAPADRGRLGRLDHDRSRRVLAGAGEHADATRRPTNRRPRRPRPSAPATAS